MKIKKLKHWNGYKVVGFNGAMLEERTNMACAGCGQKDYVHCYTNRTGRVLTCDNCVEIIR